MRAVTRIQRFPVVQQAVVTSSKSVNSERLARDMSKINKQLEEAEAEVNKRCGNCGILGHEVKHCVAACIAGDIKACPVCNTAEHLLDECSRWRGMFHAQQTDLLIVRRGRRPPIRTHKTWMLWLDELPGGIATPGRFPLPIASPRTSGQPPRPGEDLRLQNTAESRG
jgi:hypothetical protein